MKSDHDGISLYRILYAESASYSLLLIPRSRVSPIFGGQPRKFQSVLGGNMFRRTNRYSGVSVNGFIAPGPIN